MADVKKHSQSDIQRSIDSILSAYLAQLREIKQIEIAWLDKYTLIALPAAGFLITNGPNKYSIPPGIIWIILLFYLLLTMWVQDILRKERYSYYSVLRVVIRAQKHLGLFGTLLPKSWANYASPKGVGPDIDKDGTQPFSSFLNRILYILFIFCTIIGAAIYQDNSSINALALILLDILWIIIIFNRDRFNLKKAAVTDVLEFSDT